MSACRNSAATDRPRAFAALFISSGVGTTRSAMRGVWRLKSDASRGLMPQGACVGALAEILCCHQVAASAAEREIEYAPDTNGL